MSASRDFRVSTTFREHCGLDIDLPGSTNSVTTEESLPEISVNEEGELFYQGQTITLEGIEQRIGRQIADGGFAGAIIRADERVNYGLVVMLMDTLRRIGVKDLVVATRPLTPPKTVP